MTTFPLLPTPSLFPGPAGLPPSPAAADPLFGVNPFGPGNMYLAPNPLEAALEQTPAQLLQSRAITQAQLMSAAQFTAVNRAAGGVLPSDPRTWTPEQAAQQTDRALAKLSTVNPKLAETLAARRTGEDSGRSFFDQLKGAIGTVLKPGLEVGGRVLDLVSRTANIVPNLAFDMADGGAFTPGKDIGAALTGEVRHNWNSVLQEMGWTGGGIGGIVRASLGLVGDIATDPITYLIPAGAGMKASEAAELGARKAATVGVARAVTSKSAEELASMGLGDVAKFVAGRSEGDVVELLQNQWKFISGALERVGARAGSITPDAAERAAALANAIYKGGEADLYRKMWEVGDRTYRLIEGRGLRTAARKGLQLSDGTLVSARDVRSLFEEVIRSGAWQGRTSSAWSTARAFASVNGGLRLKAAVPFTDFRYISSPLWDMRRFMPHVPAQAASRFFAGQSGMNNLLHEVQAGTADWSVLRDWMERGWNGTKELPGISKMPEHAEVVGRLRGRGMNLGGQLYSASERIGGITSMFDASARAARTGLPGKWGYKAALDANNRSRDFIRGLMARAVGEDQNIIPDLETHFGRLTEEQKWAAAKYMSYFPKGLDTSTPEAIEKFFREVTPEFSVLETQASAHAGGDAGQVLARLREGPQNLSPLTEEESASLSRLKSILKDMKKTAQGVLENGELVPWTPQQKELFDRLGARWNTAKEEATKWEARVGDTTLELAQALGIHPAQVETWRAGAGVNHAITQGEGSGVWYIQAPDAQAHRELLNRGINEGLISHSDMGSGVRVTSRPLAPDDVPVAIRGSDYVLLDESGNAQLQGGLVGGSAERTVTDVKQDIHQAVSDTQDLGDLIPGVDEAVMAQKESQLLTEAYRADRPNAAGVVRPLEGGGYEARIFDTQDVKRVGEDFNVVRPNQGYMPRRLNDATRVWINGVIPKKETQILLAEPQIQAELARKTAGMTLEEADSYVRTYLQERFPQASASSLPARMWESDFVAADTKYLNALAQDISAQAFGKFSDRMDRLGRMAPFMFGSAPRSQQYELSLSKPWIRMLAQSDKKLVKNVLRLKKQEAAMLEQWHKVLARGYDSAGSFAALMDEADVGLIDLPDRELEAILKYRELATTADEGIAQGQSIIASRRAAIDQELARYEQAKAEFLDRASPPEVPTPPVPGSGEAVPKPLTPGSGAAAEYPEFKDLQPGVDYIPGKTLPTGERIPAVRIKGVPELGRAEASYPVGEIEYVKTSDLYDQADKLPRGGERTSAYTPEQLQAYKDYVARNGQTHPVEVQVTPEGRVQVVDGNHALEINNQLDPDGYTAVWRSKPDPRVDKLPLHEQLRAPDIYAGESLNSFNPETFRSPRDVASQVFDQQVADGQVYHNANTRSIFTREGNLVQNGGGARLRSPFERDLELKDLADQEAELVRAKEALDSGTRYKAPESAQAGQRRPGEHRTVPEAGEFAAQRAQGKLEATARAHKAATKEATQAGRVLGRLRTQLNNTANTVNKAYAEAKGIRASMMPALVKIETAGDLGGLTRLRVPGLEGFAMPSFMAEELHRVVDVRGPSGLASEWRKWVLGPWKRWATYRWPGFHVRNMYGAWFNNFLGGVTAFDYGFSWRVNNWGNKNWADRVVSNREFDTYQLAELFGKERRGSLTYGEVKEHLSNIGVGSANTRSVLEAADTADAFKSGMDALSKGSPGKFRSKLQYVDGKMRDFGAGVEDYHRVAAWGRGMASTEGDTWGARSFVMLRHGDYAELTNAEDHIRDLIPFYKWMRTNAPYQLRMMAENPGGTALVASKVKSYAYDVAGVNQTQAELGQPAFMKQTLAIPLPSWIPLVGSKGPDNIKYAMIDMPYNDLYNGLNDYMSAALPVVRNLFESYGIKQQVFTGKPLTGRMNKLSGAFNLPGIRDLLSAAGVASKGADGSLYIQDRLENVLTAWPIYSRFRNFMEADQARVEQRVGGVFSMLAGIGVRASDATQAELDFYYNEVQPLLQQYTDMGVTFPTAQEFTAGANAVAPKLPTVPQGLY